VDAFANGEDIYCASASKMFGVPVVKHGTNGHLRQKGKEQDMCIDFMRDSITAANAGVLCGKLTQLASGAVYTDSDSMMRIHSHKLEALEDLIEAQNGKPVLIAYWYKHERDSIMEHFDCREIKTDADITDWNAGKIPIALIQPSSAGHGLNLQDGGSTIIWYTMPWSLELYQQTGAVLDLFDFKKLIYFALVFFAIKKFKKHPILYIAASAVVGIALMF